MYTQKRNSVTSLPISTFMCMSVSDLYISRISLSILLQVNMWTDCGNIRINRLQTHECRNWDWGHAIPFLGIFVSIFFSATCRGLQSAHNDHLKLCIKKTWKLCNSISRKRHQNQYLVTLLGSPVSVKKLHLHILCVDGMMVTRDKKNNRLRTQNGSSNWKNAYWITFGLCTYIALFMWPHVASGCPRLPPPPSWDVIGYRNIEMVIR